MLIPVDSGTSLDCAFCRDHIQIFLGISQLDPPNPGVKSGYRSQRDKHVTLYICQVYYTVARRSVKNMLIKYSSGLGASEQLLR
jgi:hypothetical protein